VRAGKILCEVLALLLLSTLPIFAAERRPLSRSTDGGHLYREACAPCHGRAGGGDGPDASSFAPPPTDLRATFRAGHDTAALVARVLDGRRLALTIDRDALGRRVDDVEAIVAHLERLSRVDWSVAGRGEELWIDRCESCHGQFGRALPTSADDLRKTVRHRRDGLPPIPPLASEADEKALLAFTGLLAPGFETYERYCAGCHGGDGHGAGGDVSASGLELPRVVFDRSYFATHDADYVRTKAWHMLAEHQPRMPHFRGRLTEPQARAVVEYLRALR
jgi:mono/diheme cytochrome c family protein